MSNAYRSRRRIALALIVTLAAAKGVFLSVLVPPFHGPDEPYHFDYAQAIAENGALPAPTLWCSAHPMFSPEVRAVVQRAVSGVAFHPDRRLPAFGTIEIPSGQGARATTGCGPASIYPPLWYLAAAVAYRAAGDRPLLERLLVVRWVSVLCGCLVAAAAFAIGILLVGPLPTALLFALTVTLQPMAGLLTSLGNSEAGTLAASAVTLAAITALYRGVAPRRSAVVLAVALVAGVLSRPGFALALPCFSVLCWMALRRRRLATPRTIALFVPACATIIAYTAANGERVGMHHEIPSSGSLSVQLSRHVLSGGRLFEVWVRQYWMKLGWMDTAAPRALYVAVAVAVVVAAAGYLVPAPHARRDRAIAAVVLAGTGLLALTLYVIAWRRGDLLWVQGRYVLVLFPAHLYVIFRGLGAWRRYLPRVVDPVALFPVLLLLLNAAGAISALRRFYGAGFWHTMNVMRAWQGPWGAPLFVPTAVLVVVLSLVAVAWSTASRRVTG